VAKGTIAALDNLKKVEVSKKKDPATGSGQAGQTKKGDKKDEAKHKDEVKHKDKKKENK